jgi:hypothetical protein
MFSYSTGCVKINIEAFEYSSCIRPENISKCIKFFKAGDNVLNVCFRKY